MRDRGPPEWVTGMAESVYLQRIAFAQRIFWGGWVSSRWKAGRPEALERRWAGGAGVSR